MEEEKKKRDAASLIQFGNDGRERKKNKEFDLIIIKLKENMIRNVS